MLAKIVVATVLLVGTAMAGGPIGIGYGNGLGLGGYGGGIGLGGGHGGLGLGGGRGGLGLGGYGGGLGLGGGHGGLGLGGLGYGRSAVVAAPLAVAHAAPIAVAHAAPVALAGHAKQVIDYVDAHPQYKFEYAVHDAHTGDAKQQSESRDGDVVHGSYSLVEPDGSQRTVEYTADDHNGFNAVVHRTAGAHPQIVQKVAVAAPLAIKSAPLLSAYHH